MDVLVNLPLSSSLDTTSTTPGSPVISSSSKAAPRTCSNLSSNVRNKKKIPTKFYNYHTYRRPLKKFKFDKDSGPTIDPQNVAHTPHAFYQLFITEELLSEIVERTNEYAQQIIVKKIVLEKITPKSRLSSWENTNVAELNVFFWSNTMVWSEFKTKTSRLLEPKVYLSESCVENNVTKSIRTFIINASFCEQ